MSLPKEIPELIEAGVITPDTADRIRTYYQNRDEAATNPLFIVFGILGAILVGLGIILIIAHNWDQLSLAVKTILAFIPLLSGQGICAYALLKKRNTTAWREGGSAFLFLSIGACISLIGQIYHIPGDLHSFLLSCLLLGLPLVYVMQSSVSSLLYIIGISFYATETGYWSFPSSPSYVYGFMLLAVLPHYYRLCIKKPHSNFVSFHNWIIPLSLTIALGTVAHKDEELMFVAYFSLFGLFYLVGKLAFFEKLKPASNGYKVLGAAGTTVLLMVLSFDWFWEDLRAKTFSLDEIITTPEFLVSGILTIMATSLLFRNIRVNPSVSTKPMAFIFLLFIPTFILGAFSAFAALLINVYVLIIGILTLRNGVRQDHLGLLNYGLLIISVLAICRFFDRDLSFVVRGILFVTVGIGFFAANYYTLKKRKHESG